jgi:hypothetical protein
MANFPYVYHAEAFESRTDVDFGAFEGHLLSRAIAYALWRAANYLLRGCKPLK